MGLRDLAEATKNKKKLAQDEKPFFFNAENCFLGFLKTIDIQKAGFLIKTDEDNFTLSFPIELNLTSVHRLVIPCDTIFKMVNAQDSWTNLSANNFVLFRNFFASQEYLAITEIILFTLKENKEFIILIKSQKDVNKEPFDFLKANTALKKFIPLYSKYKNIYQNTKPVYPFQKGTNTIELKVDSTLKGGSTATLFSISFKAIFPDEQELQTNINSLRLYYSIVNKIMSSVGTANIPILRENLSVCIFSKQAIPVRTYFSQLKSILIPIFGEEICNHLVVENSKNSKNQKEILQFLGIGKNDSEY